MKSCQSDEQCLDRCLEFRESEFFHCGDYAHRCEATACPSDPSYCSAIPKCTDTTDCSAPSAAGAYKCEAGLCEFVVGACQSDQECEDLCEQFYASEYFDCGDYAHECVSY